MSVLPIIDDFTGSQVRDIGAVRIALVCTCESELAGHRFADATVVQP